jgi:hypothetical protein
VTALSVELDAMMTAARNYHEALERYTAVRRSLLDYERAVRPTMSGFDGLMPVLLAVRDGRYTAYERLMKSGVRLKGFLETLEQVSPPPNSRTCSRRSSARFAWLTMPARAAGWPWPP